MSGFFDEIIKLITGLITLILVLYILAAVLTAIEFGKVITQFIQSIGFGALIAAAIIVFYVLYKWGES